MAKTRQPAPPGEQKPEKRTGGEERIGERAVASEEDDALISRLRRRINLLERENRSLREGSGVSGSDAEPPVITARLDPSGTIIDLNRFGLNFLGYRAEDVLRRPFIGTLAPERESSGRDLRTFFDDILRDPDRYSGYEHEAVRRDGTRVWIRWSAVGDRDESGVLRDVVIAGIDLSDHMADEDRLRFREREFQTLSEHSPDAITRFDRDFICRYANPATERIVGVSRDMVIGKTFEEIGLPAEGAALWREHIGRVFDSGGESAMEFDLLTRTGEWSFHVRMIPEVGERGGVESVLAVSHDITDLKQAERSLREAREIAERRAREAEESRRLLQALLDSVPEAITLMDSPEARVRMVSRYSSQITGLLPGAVEGLPIEEFFGKVRLTPVYDDHPDGAGRLPPLLRAVRNGEIITNEEWVLIRPDGTRITVLINAAPIRDDRDRLMGGVTVWRDISDRKRAEDALLESEERYRTLSEIISDYAFSFRVEPGPTLVSEWMTSGFQRITGYSPEEIEEIGGINILTFSSDAEPMARFLEKLLARETNGGIEYRIVTRSGEVRWLDVSARSKWDREQGRVVRLYGAARDITDRKRAEEALRESEERYRRMVETAEEGIWILNTENCTVFSNDKLAGMLGYTVEEMLGQEVFHFIDPEWEPVMRENLRLRRQGRRGQYDFKFRRKDGTVLWVMISATPLFDDTGNYAGSFAMITDITERKRAEQELVEARDELEERVWRRTVDLEKAIEELRQEIADRQRAEEELLKQKELLQTVVDSIPVMLVVTGPESDVRLLNREFERLTGWDTGKARTVNLWEQIYPQRKDRDEFLESMRSLEREWREVVMFSRDGNQVESAWVNVRLSDGTRIGIGIDITERRRMETALRTREREFEALVENAPDVIARFDRNSRLVYVNRAVENETGFSPERLLNMPSGEAGVPKEIIERWAAKLRNVVETGREETIEIGIELPEGWKWYFSRMAPVLAPDGSVDSVLSISHNITELKIAEEELRKHREHLEELVEERTAELERSNAQLLQEIAERKRVERQIQSLNENLRQQTAQLMASNKELEAFSYSVSHDLRSPLRSIDGFSQALLEDYAIRLDDEGRDYLQRIRTSTQRMGQLIDDLLNLARVARTDMQHTPVNLSAIAREIAADLRRMNPERQIDLVIQDNLMGEGDPGLLKQVLQNLLGNAWKFTELVPNARIEFGESTIDGERTFFVRDNGAGFDMRYVNKLFLPFQRLHSKEEFPGTGIGLAIVRRIIQRHGGRVWAAGEPGKGAVFYFTLQ